MAKLLLIMCLVLMSFSGRAHEHHHPKHNMVMMGEDEIFLSHIVYKVPHNYQVILKVKLDTAVMDKYLDAKNSSRYQLFIFLLDEMDISKIAAMTSISGSIYGEGLDQRRVKIAGEVSIASADMKIVFFDEVPLDLR